MFKFLSSDLILYRKHFFGSKKGEQRKEGLHDLVSHDRNKSTGPMENHGDSQNNSTAQKKVGELVRIWGQTCSLKFAGKNASIRNK